jgi:hypothetical protein
MGDWESDLPCPSFVTFKEYILEPDEVYKYILPEGRTVYVEASHFMGPDSRFKRTRSETHGMHPNFVRGVPMRLYKANIPDYSDRAFSKSMPIRSRI